MATAGAELGAAGRLGHEGVQLAGAGRVADELAGEGRLVVGDRVVARVGNAGGLPSGGVIRAGETVAHVPPNPSRLGFSSDVARRAADYTARSKIASRAMPFRSSKVGFAATPGQRSIAGAFADDFAAASVEGHLGEGAAELASNLLDAQDLLSNALDLYDGGDDQDDSSELAHVSEGMTAQVTAALAALRPAQRAAVVRHLGPPEVIAYRLAEARPLHHGP
jgi:hypothetical protein